MDIDEDTRARVGVLGSILIRAFAVGVGLLLVWFILVLVGKGVEPSERRPGLQLDLRPPGPL